MLRMWVCPLHGPKLHDLDGVVARFASPLKKGKTIMQVHIYVICPQCPLGYILWHDLLCTLFVVFPDEYLTCRYHAIVPSTPQGT